MTLRVGIIQINVTDLEAAWRFYVEVLGLQGVRELGPGRAFELRTGGPGPRILVYPVQRTATRQYPDDTGVTVVFYTDDIARTVGEWTERGVEFVRIAWSREPSGVAYSPFGSFIAFRDPFGNVHELLEPAAGEESGEERT